ncbi:hypothetical protein HY993_00455 [Candidatus Micrarchaeota archaeon]|nr:hypothetical protein [Candidatus Micrarchaeota archaeon]
MNTDTAKQLVLNAVFWAGIFAILVLVFSGNLEVIAILAALIIANFILWEAVAKKFFEQGRKNPDNTRLGFHVTPIAYPKILDSQLRDFAPEFLRFDITANGAKIFTSNLPRDSLRQLRELLDSALSVKQVVAQAKQSAKKTSGKKTRP